MRPVTGLILLIALSFTALSGCIRDDSLPPVKPGRVPQVTQLTDTNEVFEANPIFSPDGAWILFESEVTGNRDLWMMPAEGGEPIQVTTYEGFDTAPFWSPDGMKVVFESDRSGFKNIWILDLSTPGSEPVPLTSGEWDDGDPVWSSDGTLIAYESNREKDFGSEIWMSPADGGEAVRLTTTGDGVYHRTADWSPDSGSLVFESNREEDSSALFSMPAIGGAVVTRVTSLSGYEGHPAWSPDGREIAFESTATGLMEVFVIPAAGGTPFQVTTEGGFWPRWSPDGSSIVYGVYGDPEPNIWVVEVDW